MGPKPAQKENGKKRELLANSSPLRTFAPASAQIIVVAKQPAGNQAAVQSQNVGQAAFASNSQVKSSLSTQGSPRMSATENTETSTVRQFQLSREKATGMSRDVTAIVREIQEAFPNYTLILSLISKWSGNDRELSTAMGTPHLDALFTSLENQRINIGSWRTAYMELESKALDRLIHLFDNRTVTHDLFHSFIKDSNAYRDYVAGPNITALWQWEMMLADELREEIERGNYDIVQKKLDQVTITDRDDVSVSLVANMTEKDILSITKSEPGNALLTRLLDELSAGNYEEDERRQANRIFRAKTAAFAASKSDPEKDLFKADIKIFPHRKTGLTVGLFSAPAAQFSVWRSSRPGYIWVQLNHGVYKSAAYRKEVETFGYATFWEGGLELREDELIKVKQYDKGGKEEYWPALKLLEISNEDTTHTFQKIVEVSSLPLLLFMAGPSAVAKTGWAAASWGARAARILQIADYVTTGAGMLTTVLLEHRGWFLKEWGEPGQDIVDAIERVNSAVLLYGFIRLATQMPSVVRNLNKAAQEWRKAVRDRKDLLQSLEKPQRDAIANLDEGLYRYEKSIRDVIAANDNLELPVNTGVSTKTGPSASYRKPHWDEPTPPGAGGQRVNATGTGNIAPPTAVRLDSRPPSEKGNDP